MKVVHLITEFNDLIFVMEHEDHSYWWWQVPISKWMNYWNERNNPLIALAPNDNFAFVEQFMLDNDEVGVSSGCYSDIDTILREFEIIR